jgi:hypothetical protein
LGGARSLGGAGGLNREIDCSFLEKMLGAEPVPFVRLTLEDPIGQMMQLVDLSGFED